MPANLLEIHNYHYYYVLLAYPVPLLRFFSGLCLLLILPLLNIHGIQGPVFQEGSHQKKKTNENLSIHPLTRSEPVAFPDRRRRLVVEYHTHTGARTFVPCSRYCYAHSSVTHARIIRQLTAHHYRIRNSKFEFAMNEFQRYCMIHLAEKNFFFEITFV